MSVVTTAPQQQNQYYTRPKLLSPRHRAQLAAASRADPQVDATNPVDLNYAYMLLYINCNNIRVHAESSTSRSQGGGGGGSTASRLIVSTQFSMSSYDHVRTMFVMRAIEQLLVECDREFLGAIVGTAITANPSLLLNAGASSNSSGVKAKVPVFSVHNEKFLDLITRHLKTIYGASFYSGQPNSPPLSSSAGQQQAYSAGFNLNNTTYMEVCVYFKRFIIWLKF